MRALTHSCPNAQGWWNGFNDWRNNVRGQWCAVYHFAGNGMIAHMQAGSTVWDVTIPLGSNYTLLNTYLPSTKLTRRIDLFNAEGDGFHIGCRYY